MSGGSHKVPEIDALRSADARDPSFEITPEVAVVEAGAVERTLAAQLKPQRIADKR